ncbi:MAG TPA: nuclear transport factor 2 family protein [Ensifer sp.]|uniref:nuclear transport factor 2 family protein n=1 Tax=Ensifer sp. TaxID=1872086 RepID=UPI002E0D7252|nr:nuclear transport factor 2 family protein [Ensifer sp.]
MHDFNAIAEAYVAAWNASDVASRAALIEKVFSANVSYRDPIMQGDGHAGIDGLIAGVQGQFPGFRFTLKGDADGFADTIRFSWALGPEGVPSVIEGTDVCEIESGRLKSVTGFLDKVPAR